MFRSMEDRYYNDVMFHNMVDLLVSYIEQLSTTPTEIREIALFAQILFENSHPRIYRELVKERSI